MAKRLAKFDASKHPRGRGGRFTNTPDQPKLSKARVYGTDNSSRKASRKKLSSRQQAKLDEVLLERASKRGSSKVGSDPLSKARVYGSDSESRKLLLSRMSKAQKLRLLAAFEIADKQKVETPVAVTEPSPSPTKAKRSKLTPEEKAAKAAEDKAAKEAEKQRKAEEKAKDKAEAAKEADKLAKQKLKADRIAAREAEKAEKAALSEADKALYEDYKAKAKAKIYDNIKAGVKDPLKVSIKRDPTSRPEPQKDSVTFTEAGVEIWKDKPNFGRFEAGFKVRESKDFEYSVEHEGQKLVLNKAKKVYEYGGELVEGIPDTHHKLRDLKPEQLFSRLAESMRHTENSTKGVTAPAPMWRSSIHGAIPKEYVRSKKGAGDYGEMQIHHVDQWAQRRFDEITNKLKYNLKTKRYEDGEITLEEAKTQMSDLLVQRTGVDKNGKTKTWWEISPKAQKDRRLVVLAAGTHEVTSPLFLANHPKGINPETGKLETFGIPEDGDSGREYFNAWRAGFWAQHHRREAYVFRQEINRRVRAGDINPEQAKTLWDDAHEKVVKSQEFLLELRRVRGIERRATKAAKEEIEQELGS